ncbi:hypothetical protein DY000_02030999 [Brassica cretica]|uniref:Uncharacterized protein n=1 Tax=Brassica cretica TaxID=69181 RepID=A0ABQ7DW82_BRACR|nr:hypothetical protein DY000_02030999 [Brassica cretica]
MEGRSGGRLKAWQQPLEKEELAAETLRRSRERLERMGLISSPQSMFLLIARNSGTLIRRRTGYNCARTGFVSRLEVPKSIPENDLLLLEDNQNKSLIQRRLSELEVNIGMLAHCGCSLNVWRRLKKLDGGGLATDAISEEAWLEMRRQRAGDSRFKRFKNIK